MTPQEIKANAPEGATHYAWYCGTYCYFTKIGHTVYWASGVGRPFTFASVTKLKPL